MKKIIGVMLLIVIALTGCAKETPSLPDWYYYNWHMELDETFNPVEISYESLENEPIPVKETVSDQFVACFDSAKEKLIDYYGDYKDLNWERFEKAKLCEGLDMLYSGCDAWYIAETNEIYAFQYLKGQKDKEVESIMAHELIHALTAIEGEGRSVFYEGLTQYMSSLVYGESDMPSYEMPTKFVEIYADKNGLAETIRVFSYDSCQKEIDKMIGKEGVAGNIEIVLWTLSSQYNNWYAHIAFDVMAHYCQAIDGDRKIVDRLLNKYRVGIDHEDEVYYDAILDGRIGGGDSVKQENHGVG